jgi:hypothetical protein
VVAARQPRAIFMTSVFVAADIPPGVSVAV